MTIAADDGPFLRVAEWALSALGGALIMLVAFRTKIALMVRDTRDVKAKALLFEKRIDERLNMLDRRTLEMLRLMADIARAVNVDQRFSDTVLRMLADDGTNGDS